MRENSRNWRVFSISEKNGDTISERLTKKREGKRRKMKELSDWPLAEATIEIEEEAAASEMTVVTVVIAAEEAIAMIGTIETTTETITKEAVKCSEREIEIARDGEIIIN